MAQRLPRHLPMRLVPIGKPHVHHERISVVGAFNPIGARLWFQSHRDKSHFPNCPMGGEKNLRLEGTSALRSDRRRRIAPGAQSKRFGFVPRGTQSFPPAGDPGVTAPPGLSTAQPFVRIAPRHSLQDLIFECRAFGVILWCRHRSKRSSAAASSVPSLRRRYSRLRQRWVGSGGAGREAVGPHASCMGGQRQAPPTRSSLSCRAYQ